MTSPCPICGGPSKPSYSAADENHRCSSDRFDYAECTQCGTIFLTNPPTDLGRYYEAEYYEIPTLERLEAIARQDRTKIAIVNRFARGKRLLEIGPAFGIFAMQAKQDDYTVDVVEMDERCCAFLRDSVGVGVTQSNAPHEAIAALPQHDVIALWHVIEHLPDIAQTVAAAARNLAPGGILVVAAPNPAATQFKLMGARWPHLDAPRHLTLAPSAALSALAEQHALKQVYLTTDDSEARHWNAFGWQRLVMNRTRSKLARKALFVAGSALGMAMSPLDRRSGRGSAFTLVLQKQAL